MVAEPGPPRKARPPKPPQTEAEALLEASACIDQAITLVTESLDDLERAIVAHRCPTCGDAMPCEP